MFRAVDSEDNSRGTSPTRESEGSPSDVHTPGSDTVQPKHREITLNMMLKEIFFCIAFALTTYGALHNSPTKISKHPLAVRFFSNESPVLDWYRGQLTDALRVINHADVSFVMYYAPWDAECQNVRGEFEKAAALLRDRVHFSAINCWNPGSECRHQHSKLPSWPIIMAYTVTSRGILYKGPREAQHMVNFLEMIMRPLKRVSKTEDLVNLLSVCDGVAVGYTPLTDRSKYYNEWYHTALRAREFDTYGEICFASVTSEDLAADLGVESLPSARLMFWNDTREFVGDMQNWNSSTLLQWILTTFVQPVSRVIPAWKKGFSFNEYMDGNPVLIMFTPLNPLYELLPNYALLREVTLEYENCDGREKNQWLQELKKLQHVQRLLYQQRDIKKFCREYKFKKPAKLLKNEVTSQYNKYPWNNTTQKNQKSSVFNFLLKRGLVLSKIVGSSQDELMSNLQLLEECSTKLFPAEKDFYSTYEQCQHLEENLIVDNVDIDPATSMLPREDDFLAPENLVQEHVKHYCKIIDFAYGLNGPIFPGTEDINVTSVNGLACKQNYSLHMLVVDSVRNHHFAESLGIDISKKKDETAVVILDAKHENQYVMKEDLTGSSLREFIYNFTRKNLKRNLRTVVVNATHTHYFGSNQRIDAGDSDLDIIELSSRNFRRVITSRGKVTLVLICKGGCNALSIRALASGARLLSSCGVTVQTARLDAAQHDLPHQYTPHATPSLMVFTANRNGESESRSAPVGERLTSSMVVALALRALGTPQHFRVRLELCRRAKMNTEKRRCLREVKEHVTHTVSRHLRYYRQTNDTQLKRSLYTRLQHLHKLHFNINLLHEADLSNYSQNPYLLESLEKLQKYWDIDKKILSKDVKS